MEVKVGKRRQSKKGLCEEGGGGGSLAHDSAFTRTSNLDWGLDRDDLGVSYLTQDNEVDEQDR